MAPDSRPILETLAALGREIAAAHSAEVVAARCADALTTLTGAAHVSVGFRDADGSLTPVASRGDAGATSEAALLAVAADFGPLEFGADAGARLTELGLTAIDLVTGWIGTPIYAGTGVGGAISLTVRGSPFAAGAVVTTRAIAAQAGVALQNTQLLRALSQGKREWEQTVDAIKDGICVLDADGTIRRANRAFCALADIPVTEVAGRPWVTLIPPTWVETFQRIVANPDVGVAELRAGDRLFHLTGLPLRDAGPASVVLVVSDQTDKRRLQEQLIQSEKMSAIGQLIAGVAHDLNNPLASVVGFADYLVEISDQAPPTMLEPLRAIQQEAERAANIVKNLLSFARKQERGRRVTPIKNVLASTLQLLRNHLMAAKVETDLDVAPGVPNVCVDVNQIQQVFVNLINNALQAMEGSGIGHHIVVRAIPWLDGVAVTVEDDGPGIPAEHAARVFEPFYTTKGTGQGTGLGLSISQGIVKEHGGRLTLVSGGPPGATFRVELPTGVPAQGPGPAAPAASAVRPLNILVVDDEPHIQHYMRATLEAWGHTVTVAADGRSGLTHALREPFDIIICDLRMPDLGGREMFAQLQAARPEMAERVVFSTGDTVRGDTLRFLESLNRPNLRKPFTLVELRAALAEASRR
jgi:two-component system NtrC family sensor kinase